jgi:hypothetical protein
MSEVFDSLMIMNEALDDIQTHDGVLHIHEYTKAVLAVLDRHRFLTIVDLEQEERDEG